MRLSTFKSKKFIIPAAVIVIIAGTLAVLEVTNTTYLFHERKAVSGEIPVTHTGNTAKNSKKSKDSASDTKSSSSKPSASTPSPSTPQPVSDKSAAGTGTPQSSLPLQTPYGSLVSNHSPNLGGSPAPSQEESVCITTPGATCVITFTNDAGVVKSLPSQTADASGNVYWSWDVKTAGFTVGSWKITVTASLNGESKSSSDQINLNVKP